METSEDRIKLTDDDMRWCYAEASRRYEEARRLGKSSYRKFGERKSGHDIYEIAGVAGEVALKRYINSTQALGINTFTSIGDVDGYEVKTATGHSRRLIYRPSDNPARVFVLVTTEHWNGDAGMFWLRGWVTGSEAMARGVYKDPNGAGAAFWVSADRLNPMTLLFPASNELIQLPASHLAALYQ